MSLMNSKWNSNHSIILKFDKINLRAPVSAGWGATGKAVLKETSPANSGGKPCLTPIKLLKWIRHNKHWKKYIIFPLIKKKISFFNIKIADTFPNKNNKKTTFQH